MEFPVCRLCCLRRILGVWRPETISIEQLLQHTCQMLVEQDIRQRRWKWIGHTLRKSVDSNTRQALTWNTEGKRKRWRSRNTWRRDLKADVKEMIGYSWQQLERLAQNWDAWQNHVGRLCAYAPARNS